MSKLSLTNSYAEKFGEFEPALYKAHIKDGAPLNRKNRAMLEGREAGGISDSAVRGITERIDSLIGRYIKFETTSAIASFLLAAVFAGLFGYMVKTAVEYSMVAPEDEETFKLVVFAIPAIAVFFTVQNIVRIVNMKKMLAALHDRNFESYEFIADSKSRTGGSPKRPARFYLNSGGATVSTVREVYEKTDIGQSFFVIVLSFGNKKIAFAGNY